MSEIESPDSNEYWLSLSFSLLREIESDIADPAQV